VYSINFISEILKRFASLENTDNDVICTEPGKLLQRIHTFQPWVYRLLWIKPTWTVALWSMFTTFVGRKQGKLLPASCPFLVWPTLPDGNDVYLRNVGWPSADYMTLYSRRYIHTYIHTYIRMYGVGLTAGPCTATFSDLLCIIPEGRSLSNECIRVNAPLNFLDMSYSNTTHTYRWFSLTDAWRKLHYKS
jgi:hypothetical protein